MSFAGLRWMPHALAAAFLLFANSCVRQPEPHMPDGSRRAPAAEGVEVAIPGHWIGAFTMVKTSQGNAGAGQFQLRLGLDAPNFFRARRGCYTQEGYLRFRDGLWVVEPRGPIQVDESCLGRMIGPARGSSDGLFQHRAITLSPPGRERWIMEGNARWDYIQNPPMPPGAAEVPPPPPPRAPPAPWSVAELPAEGLDMSNLDAAEALYRHQFFNNASGGQRNVAVLCLATGAPLDRLADPPQSLLRRFRGQRPAVKAQSECRWNNVRWTDRATGAQAIVHYISSLSCEKPTRCAARGGYLEGDLSASGNLYVLERRNGRWQVTSEVMEWIS